MRWMNGRMQPHAGPQPSAWRAAPHHFAPIRRFWTAHTTPDRAVMYASSLAKRPQYVAAVRCVMHAS